MKESSTTFDLSAEATRFRRNVGLLRYLFAAVLVIIVVSIVDSIVTGIILEASQFTRWLTVGIVLLLGAVAAFGYWGVFYLRSPSAASLELGPDALVLSYPGAKRISLAWNSPKFKLYLRRFRPPDRGFGNEPQVERATLWGPHYKLTRVTISALEAILETGRQKGLTISEHLSVKDGETVTRYVLRSRNASSSKSTTN